MSQSITFNLAFIKALGAHNHPNRMASTWQDCILQWINCNITDPEQHAKSFEDLLDCTILASLLSLLYEESERPHLLEEIGGDPPELNPPLLCTVIEDAISDQLDFAYSLPGFLPHQEEESHWAPHLKRLATIVLIACLQSKKRISFIGQIYSILSRETIQNLGKEIEAVGKDKKLLSEDYPSTTSSDMEDADITLLSEIRDMDDQQRESQMDVKLIEAEAAISHPDISLERLSQMESDLNLDEAIQIEESPLQTPVTLEYLNISKRMAQLISERNNGAQVGNLTPLLKRSSVFSPTMMSPSPLMRTHERVRKTVIERTVVEKLPWTQMSLWSFLLGMLTVLLVYYGVQAMKIKRQNSYWGVVLWIVAPTTAVRFRAVLKFQQLQLMIFRSSLSSVGLEGW
ncbi:hypothetical protein PROFUN_10762 [Planoprotostelium fungivorum]|uniref:Uncharacterized protein n=1 Tax=Planoprotostelium fungivorum TaxID=1890364 RepID=A0A2P6N808_9EUKA|nr:hypothetical protein PROFUN_10762 [Planoprotostelium fungivorum]